MYDFNLDKSVLIPNYKDIHFPKANRFDDFGIFGDIFNVKKTQKFGAANDSCCDPLKVVDAQRFLTH